MNLESYATAEAFEKLLCVAAKTGCNYFCFNIKITICNQCNHIDKETKQSCGKCGSKNVDYATRVIGYLKRVTHFSSHRQKEHELRHYHLNNDENNERLVKRRASLLQEKKESSTVS